MMSFWAEAASTRMWAMPVEPSMMRTAATSTPSSASASEHKVAEHVIAHCADHVRRRAGACRGNRLIRALSAEHQREVGADDSLTWPR